MIKRIGHTKIEVLQGDITKLKADVIVNAANNQLLPGGGVCGAIHQAGGPAIAEECVKLGGCDTGDAKITTAGKLPMKNVIHAVGPIFNDGMDNEAALLARCHVRSLELADEYALKSIAFPAISCGIYGYPIHLAAPTVLEAVSGYIKNGTNISNVIFALYSPSDCAVFQQALENVK